MLRVGRFSVEPVSDVSFKLNGKQQKLPVKLYSCDTPSYKPIYVEKETPQTAYIRLESFMPNGSKASEINLNKFSTAGQRFLNKSNVIVDLRANNGGVREYEDIFVKSFLFDTKKIDSEEVKYQIENTFFLKRVELSEGCYKLISPGIVQLEEISYERDKKTKNYTRIM